MRRLLILFLFLQTICASPIKAHDGEPSSTKEQFSDAEKKEVDARYSLLFTVALLNPVQRTIDTQSGLVTETYRDPFSYREVLIDSLHPRYLDIQVNMQRLLFYVKDLKKNNPSKNKIKEIKELLYWVSPANPIPLHNQIMQNSRPGTPLFEITKQLHSELGL